MGMATDYDAPRKTDDDSESIEALKERVPDKMSGVVDVDDADNPGGFELPGADLSDLDLDVVVLPPQADEFTCVSCFLVKHRSQLEHEEKLGSARSARPELARVVLDGASFIDCSGQCVGSAGRHDPIRGRVALIGEVDLHDR